MAAPPLIETHGLTKRYPGVTALESVDFALNTGEIHVLFGENGAGKSTMIGMLAGSVTPSDGRILVRGEEVAFQSVADARARGVSAVFQEFSLVPTMTVAENIFLGDEPKRGPLIDRGAMKRRAQELFESLDFDVDVGAQVSDLSRARQQMVEIAKAFHGDLSILILDEPTASLTDREVTHLFDFLRRAKDRGVGIIYISHRINEFERIADRITVLRDGQKVGTVGAAETTEDQLIEMMAGRAISEIYPDIDRAAREPTLSVENLSAAGLQGVSFEVRPGELLGVAGLVGSGKSRAFRAVMGLVDQRAGTVRLNGRDVSGASTRRMLDAGVFYLPSDRKEEGLLLGATARWNLGLNIIQARGRPFIDRGAIRDKTDEIAERVDLTQAYLARNVSQLSGGNQQKTLFGKGFAQPVDLYIFDEPTVGVDMGTRSALYRLIRDLVEEGKAVVVISSDLPEALNLSHRLLVFAAGRIAAELEGDEITEEAVLARFFDEKRTGT